MTDLKYKLNIHWLLLTITVVFIFSSCVTDEIVNQNRESSDDNIIFSAKVTEVSNTRDNRYIESGEIKEGTYGVLFKKLTQISDSWNRTNYERGIVEFGNEEGPTTGFAYYMDGDRKKDLKWLRVYGEGRSNVPFILFNIPGYESYTWDNIGSVVRFNTGKYPYSFAPLDSVTGSNDLLVGTIDANNQTQKVDVPLNHALSLLKLIIDVYPSDDGDLSNLENAEITLESIYSNLSIIDLANPTIFSPSDASPPRGRLTNYKTVTLLDPTSAELSWLGKPVKDENENKCIYFSPPFVVIPQPVPYGNNSHPKLYVKVPKEDVPGSVSENDYVVYEGTLPLSMFDADENGKIIGQDPQSLEFKPGYRLTIRASINSPNTELTFSPVTSETWVSKGTFNIAPKQAGIYKPEQFYAMLEQFKSLVDYYKNHKNMEDEDNNTEEVYQSEYQLKEKLKRFGYWDNDNNFVIQFWGEVNLEKERISLSMEEIETLPFYFIFNNYSVSVEDGNGDIISLRESEGESELYSIVTGNSNTSFIGINSEEQFFELIEDLKNSAFKSLKDLRKFGTLNNGENTITFKINASFEVDLAKIFQCIPSSYLGKTIVLTIDKDKEIEIFLEKGNGEKEIFISSYDSEYNYLNKFAVKGVPGISSEIEYDLLYKVYTEKFYELVPDFLKLFGTKSTTSDLWTFQFYEAFTLPGDKVFLKMIPEDYEGPEYTTNINSGCTITIEDPKTPCSIINITSSFYSTMADLMKGDGVTYDSSSSLTNMVSYYSSCVTNRNYNQLWKIGKLENNKWIFNINIKTTSYSYINYSSLFGKMVPDENIGKFDFEFKLGNQVEVRSVPKDLSGLSDVTNFIFTETGYTNQYPSDAAALKKMADGTYWEYYEEWKQINNP